MIFVDDRVASSKLASGTAHLTFFAVSILDVPVEKFLGVACVATTTEGANLELCHVIFGVAFGVR